MSGCWGGGLVPAEPNSPPAAGDLPSVLPRGGEAGGGRGPGVTDAAHLKQIDNRIGVDHGYFCV